MINFKYSLDLDTCDSNNLRPYFYVSVGRVLKISFGPRVWLSFSSFNALQLKMTLTRGLLFGSLPEVCKICHGFTGNDNGKDLQKNYSSGS